MYDTILTSLKDHAIGFDAQCYSFIYSPAKNFTDAQAFCKANNGNLATVDNRHVQAYIGAEMVHMPGASYWIGLHSSAQTKNQYRWTSGYTLDFTAWDRTHTGNEVNTCVAMKTARPAGLWENHACSKAQPFICETPRKGYTTAVPTTTTTSRLPCAQGWMGWGNNCYKGFNMTLENMLAWTDAREYCGNLAQGGDLATIRNVKFEDWMRTKVLSGISGSFWIGLNDRDTEAGYEWSDGFPFAYTNWGTGEPNNYQDKEDCVQWILPQNKWNDNYCYLAQNFICQIPRGAKVTTPRPTITPGPESLQCGNSSWTLYNNNCYFISPPDGDMAEIDWFEARLACQDMGAELASITGDTENGYITSRISAHPQNAFWVGLNDLDQDQYKWTDMSPLSFINWNKGEPNDAFGGEKCVEIVSSGWWNDLLCTDKRGFVCKKRPGDFNPITATTPSTSGGCPRGFHSMDNLSKCFYVGGTTADQRASYDDAINMCGQMVHKSTLASIHNSLEEKFITTMISGLTWPAWIGFNDRRTRNQFSWLDNLKIDYTNWGWKQPDENLNDNGVDARRDCVDIEVGVRSAGNWNDKKCSNKYAYVCETKKGATLPIEAANTTGCPNGYTRWHDSCYKYSPDQYTWSQAQQYCKLEGGNLVGLTSRAEQYYVELLTKSVDSLQIWIGLSFNLTTQRYAWSNGWPVDYTSWGHGEPDRALNEGCVSHLVGGRWQDIDCRAKLNFVCEISLGKPPTTPPYTPPKCPDSTWRSFGEYCYKIESVNSKSWPAADFSCKIQGGRLASIHSDEESKFLTTMVVATGQDTWIGLTRGTDAGYSWSDGSPLQYLYWAKDEPSDGDSVMHQDCGKMSAADGSWYDTDCFDSLQAICKRASASPGSAVVGPDGQVYTVPPDGFVSNAGKIAGGLTFPPGQGGQGYIPGNNNQPGRRPGNPGAQTGSNPNSSGSSDLSGGAVAGIVIGALAIVAVAAVVMYLGRGYINLQALRGGPTVQASQGYDNATYSSGNTGDKVSLSVSDA